VKKSVIGSAIVLGLAVATVVPSLGGCSASGGSDNGSGGSSSTGHHAVGTVGLDLTLPGGESITSVNWTINQGSTVVTSGTYAVPSSATTISFFIPNVAAGSGYTITLSATSPDGKVSCIGTSAPFSVTAQTTTDVNVFLTCSATGTDGGANSGGVIVNGTPVNCATWTSASANPATAVTSGVVALAAGAVAPNASAITFAWSATAGSIDTPTAATANFTCPAAPQNVTITLNVGDGTLPAGATCPSSSSQTTLIVTCGNPPCQGVGTGVEATPDTATGSCPAPSVNTGTLKDSSNNFCCSPAPCQGVGSGVEATPNTAAGTCPSGQFNSGSLKDSSGNFCCSALVPCTAAGQANCVQCQGSTGGVCTPTEAALVQQDITKGLATAAGADPAGGCYTCLYNAGGLDDVTFKDTGHECGDLSSSANQTACTTTLSCILASSCAWGGSVSGSAVSTCYCGTAPVSGSCANVGSTNAANGSCDSQEAAGLGFASNDGLDILKNFTSTTLASGVANNIFQTAISNNCGQCLH
jgi:hypothetical protein